MAALRDIPADAVAPLWTANAAARATGGEATDDWSAFGISIDSRSVAPGDLFVAIRGERFDGHEFVSHALEAGAHAAMVDRGSDLGAVSGPLLRVENTDAALQALGAAARARSRAKIAAITGSVGKTGVKEALYRCLNRHRPAHASVKSFNNEIGVPLTLARMPQNVAYGVFEIGMNHAGEIARLVPQVRPHVALVTTVEAAHAEFFESEEAIADAKAEIFLGVENGGAAVINRDNRHYARLTAAACDAGIERIVTFGIEEEADVRATQVVLRDDMSCVAADVRGQKLIFKIGVAGKHWVMNALGTLAVVDLLGADLSLAGLALAEMGALPGRGERTRLKLKKGRALLIDESYNANPASMRAAFATVAQVPKAEGTRRIAILGDMMELGEDAPAAHAELAGPLEDANFDLVVAVGELMQNLESARMKVVHTDDLKRAEDYLAEQLKAGDVIVVKGSNASGLGELAAALKTRFAAPGRRRG